MNQQPSPRPFGLSARARRTIEQPIGYLMAQAVGNPDLISLAAGLVDYTTLPSDEVGELTHALIRKDHPSSKIPLQYGATQGLDSLRRLLLDHMARLDGVTPEDFGADVEDVILTTGSQQLLFIITDALVDPGDIVLTEWPSYFVYNGALQTIGAEVRCIDTDEHGMVPESLDEVLGRLERTGQIQRVKIVYLVDYHQNPTGITLSAERRPRILEIVQRYSTDHRILLLEDAAYRELTYEEAPPPSIKHHDRDNLHVALVQTFSKTFSPGLKTGYGLIPKHLAQPILLQKGSHDFGSTNLAQHLIQAAMTSGMYRAHVARLRKSYLVKRNALLEALDATLSDLGEERVRWTRPSGGLYVWLTLPDEVDTHFESRLFRRCVEKGVMFVPGFCCYPLDRTRRIPTNSMRLSFGAASIAAIHEGVDRLAAAIREELALTS